MTAWLSLAPALFAALAVMLLPGAAIGALLRLRGILLWGFAPAASVAAISVSAAVLGLVGVRWSTWSASVVLVVLVALALVIGRLIGPVRFARERVHTGFGPYLAILLGTILGAARMASLIGSPANLSQTNDATFHLNALRFVQESGSASSLDLLGMLDSSGFYPAAWHAVTSLVIDLTGTDFIAAANAVSLAIAGPVWTLSITAFVWAATGGKRAAAVFAAVMAPALFAFPFHVLDFGVLYPYTLSLATLPGTLAVLAETLHSGQVRRIPDARRIWIAAIATLIGLAAIVFAQPSVMLSWLIGAASMVLWGLSRGWASTDRGGRMRRSIGAALVLATSASMWLVVMRVSSSGLWGPQKPATRVVVDLLLNDSVGPGPVLIMSALAVVGVMFALRSTEFRWLVAYGSAVSLLVLVAVSVEDPFVRSLLSPWYADPHRFIAMMPLVVIPLAAVGADGVVSWIRGRRNQTSTRIVTAAMLAFIVAETVIWTTVAGPAHNYTQSSNSFLSSAERHLLESLPQYVELNDRIVGNPAAGAAFGYALSGVDVVPRTWSLPDSDDYSLLAAHLVDLATDPAICHAVDRTGVDYVVDFGNSEKGAGREAMPGLTGFDDAEGFRKVVEVGKASLWRVVGCD